MKLVHYKWKDEITPSGFNYKQEESLEIETKALRKNSKLIDDAQSAQTES